MLKQAKQWRQYKNYLQPAPGGRGRGEELRKGENRGIGGAGGGEAWRQMRAWLGPSAEGPSFFTAGAPMSPAMPVLSAANLDPPSGPTSLAPPAPREGAPCLLSTGAASTWWVPLQVRPRQRGFPDEDLQC